MAIITEATDIKMNWFIKTKIPISMLNKLVMYLCWTGVSQEKGIVVKLNLLCSWNTVGYVKKILLMDI